MQPTVGTLSEVFGILCFVKYDLMRNVLYMSHSKNDTVAITYYFDLNNLVENVLLKTILLYIIVFGMTHHNTNGTGAVCIQRSVIL